MFEPQLVIFLFIEISKKLSKGFAEPTHMDGSQGLRTSHGHTLPLVASLSFNPILDLGHIIVLSTISLD